MRDFRASHQPYPDRCQQEEAQEISRSFFVASCEPAKMFELTEEVLNQVALFVENEVRWSRIDSIRPRWDHHVHPLGLSCIYDSVGVVAFICDEVCTVRCFEKTRCFADIGDVSGRDV